MPGPPPGRARARISQSDGGTFVNEANASFAIENDLTWSSDGTGTFANAGTLLNSAGTGTTTLEAALDNTGSVQVQQGTLSLQGGGVVGGTYLVLAGATLTFGNDNVTTTSVALPGDFTTSPLNWAGTFTGSAQDNSGSGLASVGVSLFDGHDYYDGTAFESPTAVFNAAALAGNSWTYTIPTAIFTSDLAYAAGSEATDNDGGNEPSTITSFLLAPTPATVSAVAPANGLIAGGTDRDDHRPGTGKRHGGRFRQDGGDHRQRHERHHRGHQPPRGDDGKRRRDGDDGRGHLGDLVGRPVHLLRCPDRRDDGTGQRYLHE